MYYTTNQNWRARQAERIADFSQRVYSRCFFPVEKVYLGMNKYAIINKETGSKISDVSKRYTLVKNQDIFQPFIERFKIASLREAFGYGRGKYTHMRINTGRRFNFGTEERPDWVSEQIIIENSYNKSRSFRFMFGAFRSVCTNGLYSGRCVINYKKIHVGEIPIQEIVSEVLNNYEKNSFELWKQFRNVNMTLEEQIKMLEAFEAFELKEENKGGWDINHKIRNRTKMYLIKEENADNKRKAWGLFNQINRAIENEVSGNSKVSQRITANIKAESYLAKVLNLN